MSQVVIGDILPYTQATATAGQTVFMTNWTADTESDVVVYKTPSGNPPNDVTQILAYPAGYSVAFIGGSQEVQVTLVTPASLGDRITITRQTPADRMNLYSNTNFTPSMLNNDFGILTLVDQQAQLVDQKIGPRYNYSALIVNVVDTILPILGSNQTWVKNNANTAIIVYDLPQNGIAPADATYVTITDETSVLPNSVNFAGLSPGLAIFDGTGFVTNPVVGTAHEITVVNGTGVAGSITLSFPDNMVIPGTGSVGLPGGTTAERVITAGGTPLRYNSTFDSLEFYSSGTWSLINDDTDGTIDPGTANQFAFYAANGNTLSGVGPLLDEQIFIGQTSDVPVPTTIVQGSGMTITYGVGTITFSATGTGGTVTSLTEGAGINLTPDTITTTGSIALAPIATLTGLVNLTGGPLAPASATLTAWMDAALGSTRGNILYRNATVWTVLAPGTAGFSLQTGGAGADPSYSNTFTNSTLVTPATLGVQQQALNMNSHLINNVTDPVSAQDAATKNYVDQTALSGTSVYAATIDTSMDATQSGAGIGATLTDASGTFAPLSLDSEAIPLNADVLVKNTGTGVTAANEGIYKLTTNGDGISVPWQLTRSVEYDTPEQINNTGLIIVQNGSTLAGTAWYNAATIVTVDTTNFNYNQFGASGTVSSITIGQNLTGSANPITTTGTITGNFQTNLITGGNFDTNPWQRGVSFALGTGQGQTADMFSWINNAGAGGVTIAKTADAPPVSSTNIFSVNCLHIDVTTADASIAASDLYALRYNMEGYDWAQIAQNPFVLSFWHKHTVTGVYCVNFFNSAQDQYFIAEYTQAVTDTWEYATIAVSASPSAGTWNYTTGIGVQMNFTIAAGSDWQGSAGAWAAGTEFCTSNQVNGMSSTSNNAKFQLIKIEPGTIATPYPFEAEEVVTARCQRYYESGMTVGKYFSAATSGYSNESEMSEACFNGNGGASVYYRTTKRVNPTFNIKAHDGTAGQVLLQTVGNVTPNAISAGTNIATLTVSGATQAINFYWEADAAI